MKTLYTTFFFTLALLVSISGFSTETPKNTTAVSIQDLKVTFNTERNMNTIGWETANFAEVNYFIVEKTVNGSDYTIIGYVFAGQVSNYRFNTADMNTAGFRVKAVSNADVVFCSSSIKMNNFSDSNIAKN